MSKIVLIHGFASGIRYSIFRPACGADAGFTAFKKDVEDGTAKVFRWDIADNASFLQSVDPRFSLTVYKKEYNRVQNSAWQEQLYSFLKTEQSSTVVCHSLGCLFLLEAMNRYGLPTRVRTIVFNQSGTPTGTTLTNADVEKRIDDGSLTCINTYCPWDPTLLASAVVQGVIRDGLFPTRKPWLQNIFIPLLRPFNLHTGSIRSPKFRNWIKQKTDV